MYNIGTNKEVFRNLAKVAFKRCAQALERINHCADC